MYFKIEANTGLLGPNS